MAEYDTILIRYGELSTKGHNRKNFIRRLEANIRQALAEYPHLQYRRTYDRIYIKMTDEDPQALREKLSRVFGISSFSFTQAVDSDMEAITRACLQIAAQSPAHTFKMITRRHDKSFPLNSDAINRAVADAILQQTDKKVDVHHPELPIQVEVQARKTYITAEKIPGAGGYPVGINGKCLVLLSGGIDSPVAVYEMMKRGIEVEALHFASPPYTSEQAKEKMLTLASMLSVYQGSMKVHIVSFTDLQLAIYKAAGDPYAVTLMRRMMFRIAERIAAEEGCLVLGTGESIGQVASQTLESMVCINSVIRIPVIRPLACLDKVEIIDLARRIGTYETSILPYEDCCTIFDPKNPVTRPHEDKAAFYEARFDWQSLVETCVQTRQTQIVTSRKEQEEFL